MEDKMGSEATIPPEIVKELRQRLLAEESIKQVTARIKEILAREGMTIAVVHTYDSEVGSKAGWYVTTKE
jgi:hypothetical protein